MGLGARISENRDLEADVAEIRMRAKRRIGELMQDQRETVGLNRGQLHRGSELDPREEKPTLAEAGIDKHLADRARKLAAQTDAEFEIAVSVAAKPPRLSAREAA